MDASDSVGNGGGGDEKYDSEGLLNVPDRRLTQAQAAGAPVQYQKYLIQVYPPGEDDHDTGL